MLEYFKYIIDLKKYNKKIDENDKLYKDLIEKAKRNNKPE
jgi:hypothetical protein